MQADKLFLASAVIAGAAYISGMKDGETVSGLVQADRVISLCCFRC